MRGFVLGEFEEQSSHERLAIYVCLFEEFPDIWPDMLSDVDVLDHDAFDLVAI